MQDKKSFEDRLESAKEILDRLQKSDISLQEAIKLYKKGKEELQEALKMLEEAQIQISEYKNNDKDE